MLDHSWHRVGLDSVAQVNLGRQDPAKHLDARREQPPIVRKERRAAYPIREAIDSVRLPLRARRTLRQKP